MQLLHLRQDLTLVGAFHVGALLLFPFAATSRAFCSHPVGRQVKAQQPRHHNSDLQTAPSRQHPALETTAILQQETAPTAGMRALARSVSGASTATTLSLGYLLLEDC